MSFVTMAGHRRKNRNVRNANFGKVSSWARTDVGRKREKNEDNYLEDPSLMLYGVADGMGGHAAGETASSMAVQTIHRWIKHARSQGNIIPNEPENVEYRDVLTLMERAVSEASSRIFDASNRNPAFHGMGTTVTLSMFLGPRLYIAHVGDSRLYRFREGKLEQLTDDHSLVAEQVRAGLLTPEEAQFSRFRNIITRSVGFESEINADLFSVAVLPGDVFLVCSDGLTGMVSDEEIEHVLATQRLNLAAAHLINLANRAGGEDNITLVITRYKGHLGSRVSRRHLKKLGKNRPRWSK